MKKQWKRGLTLALAAVMLLGLLAGCGDKEEKPSKDPDATQTPEYVYIPEYLTLETETGNIGQTYAVGDQLFFTSYLAVGKIQELYPISGEGYYFSIDGDDIRAEKINNSPAVAVPAMDIPATSTDVVATEPTEEEIAAAEQAAAEKQAAIEEYVQYDENGELIVPDGYEFYEYDKWEQVLMRMNVDGTGITRLENYERPTFPEGVQGDCNINRMMGDAEGNLWVLENVYTYTIDEAGNYMDNGETNYLRQLDETGAELKSVDFSKVQEASDNEYFYIYNICMDNEGNIYVSSDTEIIVSNADGEVLFKVTTENWVDTMVRLADGRVAATVYEEEGQMLKIVDPAKKDWGDSYKAPNNIYSAITGSGEYDLYFNDGSMFYGYNLETGETTEIVNWLNCDINADYINSVVPLEDGRIAVLLYNWNSETRQSEMAVLSKQPYSALGEKTILTLACMYDYEIRDLVINFNKSSDKYRIEVQNYSQYNDYNSENEEDWNAGLTKLSTEIVAGNVPDLLMLDSLPYQQYITKGLLEDLYPYLDNDPELSRDQLLGSVLKAAEFNGGLYQTISSFNIQTVVCPTSVVGPEPGWTLAEMRAIQDTMPEGSALFQDITKEQMLRQYFYMGGADFIDWETGKCSFNSEGFIDLLEYANTFPAEIDWENYEYEYVPELVRLQEGSLLGMTMYVNDITNYLRMKAMFGGEMTVMGYPCEDRNGNILRINGGMAMSSTCADKDGAWQFLRSYFLPQGDGSNSRMMYRYGLPINRADMDELVAQAMKKEYYKDENGKQVLQPLTTWWMDNGTPEGYEIKIMPAEQEDIDAFMALIESTTKVASYDTEVVDIVCEEAAAYFAGQKGAQDVATVIQSKLQTYVNEHM